MAHPRMYDDSNPAIKRLRGVCLALPEAFEKEAWGECTFRVIGGSMFAMTDNNHHQGGHVAVWLKAPPMVQEIRSSSTRTPNAFSSRLTWAPRDRSVCASTTKLIGMKSARS
jgi:hypothetical protein